MRLTIITFALSVLLSCGLYGDDIPQSTLSADVTKLTTKKTRWISDILDLEFSDGSMSKKRLELVFIPITNRRAIVSQNAKVNMNVSSLTLEISGIARVRTSIGSSPNDVLFQEKGDVRSITVTRSMDEFPNLDVKSLRYRKTQRLFDSKALVFAYELKGDTLTLKGFPKSAIVWGSCEFMLPESEIRFKEQSK